MTAKHLISSLALTLVLAAPVSAEVDVSGLLDFVARNAEEQDITNVTFKGTSNLHTTRARLFFDAPLEGENAAFIQLLADNYTIDVYGAYIRLVKIFNLPVNLNAGIIPNTVGNFGPRTYSNANPVVGVPLLWNHHSSYAPNLEDQARTVDELLAKRTERTNMGLPVLYDNCWNSGIEFFGPLTENATYSIGLLAGSVSKPAVTQKKNLPQVTGRLGYSFGPTATLGFNGFAGPYLWDGLYNDDLPLGREASDFLNYGAGVDLAYSRGYLELYSEVYINIWEHPYIDDLKASAGYVEAKYKFVPGWYAAGRFGFFEPGKLTNSNGDDIHWDYPVKRYEIGLGYHPTRRTLVKLVAQLNRFDFTDALDTDHFMLQLSVKI